MEIIAIVSLIATTASFVYAIKTYKEQKRFEKLVQESLAGIAGNVWNAGKSADKSDRNYTRARDELLKLEDSDTRKTILKHIHNGARDSVAAKRMLSNLLGVVMSTQNGMFGSDKIAHPDMDEKQVQSNVNVS